MGIYACGGYRSRSPEKPVMGRRLWGYMQEEVRRRGGRTKKEEKEEVGLSFEI